MNEREVWLYPINSEFRVSAGVGTAGVVFTGPYAQAVKLAAPLARDLKWPLRLVPMNTGWQREGVSIALAPLVPTGPLPKRPRR